ncbi:MAG: sigma-70 family RNA polymerase sigma factor [Opitutaceae bacterium]
MDSLPPTATMDDTELVALSLGGDREAFRVIVERYQRLLCSLAYSATGRMSESEDLAQEAFVTAWTSLRSLRDPERLRAWLCGILRHKVSRMRRRDAREPSHLAEPLEDVEEAMNMDESATNQTMRKEEQAILWAELERVPELYREPLVLYYREHCSVEHVAASFDLTEDAVKQRLSRGRKILQERVLNFVEGALARSTPGKVFTMGVLAALPSAIPTTAKAAGMGAVAIKGATLAKTTWLATVIASASGLVSAVMGMRIGLDQSRTPKERRAVVLAVVLILALFAGLLGLLYGLNVAAIRWWDYRLALAMVSQVLSAAFTIAFPIGLVWMMRYSRRLRTFERRIHPELFRDERDQIGSRHGSYRSKATLFGIPLVHFRFASPDEGEGPIVGWIAGGDRAYGLLFAWGLIAVAPISVGAFSVGLLSVGSVGIGAIALGNFVTGLIAVGCVSFGVHAASWLSAVGWETARSGGIAIARLAAQGPIAFAQHANNEEALQIFADPNAEQNHMILLIFIALAVIVPVSFYAREVRRRMGRK